jgi:hypothetical protein
MEAKKRRINNLNVDIVPKWATGRGAAKHDVIPNRSERPVRNLLLCGEGRSRLLTGASRRFGMISSLAGILVTRALGGQE